MTLEDIDLSRRYYYSHNLDCDEQALYRFMLDLILKRQYRFRYFHDSNNTVWDEEYPTLIAPTTTEYTVKEYYVFDVLYYDFPELFFIADTIHFNKEQMYFDMEPNEPALRYTEEEISEIWRGLDEIYHHFDGVADGFDLELAVNNYIIERYDYDYDVDTRCGRDLAEAFTVVSLIKRGMGVCAAITKLAQYIFTRRGMEAVTLVSTPPPGERGHCWLAIKLDGKFYHLDITDNESMSRDLWSIQHSSFNITDSELARAVPYYERDMYPGLVCNSKKHNYYYHLGLYFRNEEELCSRMKCFINEHKCLPGEQYFYFRVPRNIPKYRVKEWLSHAVRGAGFKRCAYLDYDGYYTVEFTFN